MIRSLMRSIILFLLPFIGYGLLLMVLKEDLISRYHWSKERISLLSICGLALAIMGILVTAKNAPQHKGAFIPAQIKDNKLIPGYIE